MTREKTRIAADDWLATPGSLMIERSAFTMPELRQVRMPSRASLSMLSSE
jgi:hypothetical protein